MAQRYLIALGSNQRHHRHGRPEQVLIAALKSLTRVGVRLIAVSPLIRSTPLGPSRRQYANGTAIIAVPFDPETLLNQLKVIERQFGRKPTGQRWSNRVLDLDIVLWSGGTWSSPTLTVPHRAFRQRDFVLQPSLTIAAHWRDPLSGFSLRQLHTRLTRPHHRPR